MTRLIMTCFLSPPVQAQCHPRPAEAGVVDSGCGQVPVTVLLIAPETLWSEAVGRAAVAGLGGWGGGPVLCHGL